MKPSSTYRSRVLSCAGLLLGAVAVSCGTPGAVVPSPGLTPGLEDSLMHPVVATPGPSPTLLGVVITLPANPAAVPEVRVSRIESSRPTGVIAPTPTVAEIQATLIRAGYYLAVRNGDGEFVSLIALGGPRVLRGETFPPGSDASAVLVGGEPTVLAARFPFPRRGKVSLFETDGAGHVTRYPLLLDLGWFAPRGVWQDIGVRP